MTDDILRTEPEGVGSAIGAGYVSFLFFVGGSRL